MSRKGYTGYSTKFILLIERGIFEMLHLQFPSFKRKKRDCPLFQIYNKPAHVACFLDLLTDKLFYRFFQFTEIG